MTRSCPNCRRPVLDNDVACWQCGWELASKDHEMSIALASRETASGSLPLQRLVVYAGWTAVIVLSTWMVVRSLGRRPVIVATEAPLQRNWRTATDVGQGFTLGLPENWLWTDGRDSAGSDQFLADPDVRRLLLRSLSHFERESGDAAILGAAIDATDASAQAVLPPFFVIARSSWLGRLTPEQVIRLAQEQLVDLDLRETSFRQSSDGQQRPTLIFEMVAGETTLRCQQQTVASGETAYILTACASLSQYRQTHADTFTGLLAGFQRLAP